MISAEQIKNNHIPEHIAVIMDGNGRWAKLHGKTRVFGHKSAVTSVREVIEGCAELGVKYLTLYAFSSENWNRPKIEINALMSLLVSTLKKELKTLNDNDIRLLSIGDRSSLPRNCKKELIAAMEATSQNSHMDVILALSYGSRWEMIKAIKEIVEDAKSNKINEEDINDRLVNSYLETCQFPDPGLLIRTSGEKRISNFLLWQIAYTELYFTDTLWPDFRKPDLYKAIYDFQHRERRFGKISEQLTV